MKQWSRKVCVAHTVVAHPTRQPRRATLQREEKPKKALRMMQRMTRRKDKLQIAITVRSIRWTPVSGAQDYDSGIKTQPVRPHGHGTANFEASRPLQIDLGLFVLRTLSIYTHFLNETVFRWLVSLSWTWTFELESTTKSFKFKHQNERDLCRKFCLRLQCQDSIFKW